MLASITPFGERGRNNRWWLTVTAYVVGSVVGGALLGLVLGSIGQLLLGRIPSSTTRTVVAVSLLAVAAGIGLVVDLGVGGLSLPTIRRQVDEQWIDTYRGWVYGLGFGLQLGPGIFTIVSSSMTYVVLAAEVLSGSWLGGLLIGTVFGLFRALPLLATRRATDPVRLRSLIGRSQAWLPPVRRAAIAVQGVAVVAALAVIPRVT
jgi:hypothetical protein